MDFPCTKCGACCRRAHLIDGFPEPLNKDGSCSHLKDDNSCEIYDERPDICRIDHVRTWFPDMTNEEYIAATIDACNQFIEEDGLPDEYKIPQKRK